MQDTFLLEVVVPDTSTSSTVVFRIRSRNRDALGTTEQIQKPSTVHLTFFNGFTGRQRTIVSPERPMVSCTGYVGIPELVGNVEESRYNFKEGFHVSTSLGKIVYFQLSIESRKWDVTLSSIQI
jgi:hypothetical protein